MVNGNFGIKSLINSSRDNLNRGVREILSRSNKAVCGAFEREVTVSAEKVNDTKARLRNKGFVIIGTSEPIGMSRKIWFIPAGANL